MSFHDNVGPFVWSLLLVIVVVVTLGAGEECTLKDGHCIYNVNLNTPGSCAPSAQAQAAPEYGPQNIKLPETAKMYQMEEDFNVVKSDHENRIKELENSIQKVLRNAIPQTVQFTRAEPLLEVPSSREVTSSGRQSGTARTPNKGPPEDTLMFQLQSQFNRLRTTLSSRSADLVETKNKLNETTDLLKETRKQLFKVSGQLSEFETKAAVLGKESNILKNKYKDKSERLEIALERLNISEGKLDRLENQLYDVVRSESTLKEEMEIYKRRLNQTQTALELLQRNHSSLQDKYSRTKTTLNLREQELMECYTAKTQTFCGFEDPDMCGFTQENETDTFDWERKTGRTPSASTGPRTDHTCKGRDGIGEGYFMFIEASGRRRGHNAIMYSPKYRGMSQQCVEFYYHMYGRHVGTLTVHTKLLTSDELQAVWRVYGNQGNLWILARLAIPEGIARAGYQMVFEGATETGYEGDIAIDDINVRDGECNHDDNLKAVEVENKQTATDGTLQEQISRYRKYLRRRQRTRGRS